MITFEQALEIVLQNAITLATEKIYFTQALGRVLGENVVSDMDMPPFNKSAVDGFACKLADISGILTVVDTIKAGDVPAVSINKGQAAKIMTGAQIPTGADCVLMIEDVTVTGNTIKYNKNNTSVNICFKGEDIKASQIVVDKNTFLQPKHIGVMATVGYTQCLVYKLPRIAILSTGNEIVEPDCKPENVQIRNSNAYQLIAQCKATGIDAQYLGIAIDENNDLIQKLTNASENFDIVLVTGGVSMGDYDLVPGIIKDSGYEILFHGIRVQPGKPTLFARKQNSFIFGLAGNPLASFVQFEMLVKPMIYALMNSSFCCNTIRYPMECNYSRRKADRKSWIPVCITPGNTIKPVEYHGSAHLNSFTQANGIICLEVGQTSLNKGDFVDVRPI